jgi:plasmid stability protein
MEDPAVATLNIKNVPDPLYRKLQARARREHRSVAQEVIHLLAQAVERPAEVSIQKLRGLGKAAWRGVDAAAHVEAERRTWN